MGIRFLCQHCEKRLNVKTTQAGIEGECPYCQQPVVVPSESMTESSLPAIQKNNRQTPLNDSDSTIALLSSDDQKTPGKLPAAVRAKGPRTNRPTTLSPRAKTKSKVGQFKTRGSNTDKTPLRGNLKTKSATPIHGGKDLFMLDKPAPPPSLGKVDPIAQAPKQVWYFRSHELGERGPLKAKQMQKFVDDGDVKIGCLVWREDWEDWLLAEKVFPDLAAEAEAQRQKGIMNRAFKDANYQIPDSLDPNSAVNRQRRRKNFLFIGAITIGIITIAGLAIVLVKLLAE